MMIQIYRQSTWDGMERPWQSLSPFFFSFFLLDPMTRTKRDKASKSEQGKKCKAEGNTVGTLREYMNGAYMI